MPNTTETKKSMKVLEIDGKQVLVKLLESGRSIWLPKDMLKASGVKASQFKVGAEF